MRDLLHVGDLLQRPEEPVVEYDAQNRRMSNAVSNDRFVRKLHRRLERAGVESTESFAGHSHGGATADALYERIAREQR